ncbi:DUF6461 domain-containing protein [Nonomuraea sp. LP-02]|uniref:DUF6461 domain-containing protein n=1 Tax=Nonomuraea sp. LP-02 TaxID=3097960 RepID=UPI002E3206DE|nr:DUF6461 domain-containing protein [Nonomuraea sp. LP-02]MED7925843.1 DUF6461 domain-containing protein [Nonomuraea sp. LP-02]
MRRSEYLWHRLHSYALATEFSAIWVDRLELDELAQRVGADFRQARRRDRAELADEAFDIRDATVIWADRLTDDWLQIFEFRGYACSGALRELSAHGGRAVNVGWGLNGVRDLTYVSDGYHTTGFSITVPGERSGNAPAALDALAEGLMFDMDDTSWMTDPELPPEWPAFEEWSAWMEENGYSVGDEDGEQPLPEAFGDFYGLSLNGYHPSLATCVTSALTLVGRLTGREIDEAWLTESHTRLTIPHRL